MFIIFVENFFLKFCHKVFLKIFSEDSHKIFQKIFFQKIFSEDFFRKDFFRKDFFRKDFQN